MDRNTPLQEEIRILSYLLWEQDGRPEGRSEEYWRRANAALQEEIDQVCQAESLTGEIANFVPPRLPISLPPRRYSSKRIPELRTAA